MFLDKKKILVIGKHLKRMLIDMSLDNPPGFALE